MFTKEMRYKNGNNKLSEDKERQNTSIVSHEIHADIHFAFCLKEVLL